MDELMNMMDTTENYIESREVAEMIGRAHSDLLKDIRRYCEQLSQGNFTLRDFFKESEFNNRGKKYPCYLITKKGCELIAHNSVTGVKINHLPRLCSSLTLIQVLTTPNICIVLFSSV